MSTPDKEHGCPAGYYAHARHATTRSSPLEVAMRDRGYLREQADRIVAKRRARYKRETPGWQDRSRASNHDEWFAKRMSHGRLADRDPWDCGNPQCGVCRDPWHSPRARDERRWRAVENIAY